MLFVNKNIKVINCIVDYYEGKASSIPYTTNDIENALEYIKKYRSDYPDEIIEKLLMVKVLLQNN